MFFGFLMALLQTNLVNAFWAGLFCIMWLINAFIEKKYEELKR
jgi:hypothetical protein